MEAKYLWYNIEIAHDDYPENPREWDNLWTLVTAHRNYSWDEELPHEAWSIEWAFKLHLEENWLSLWEVYYHQVYLYEHSGVTISTRPFACNFDSWLWWFIYVSIEKAKEELQTIMIESTTLEYLDNEIKTLDRYFTWEIYEYRIPLLDEYRWWYESEEEALEDAKDFIASADPEGKTMAFAEHLYECELDIFWDRIWEEAISECENKDWSIDEGKRDMIINIIWNNLKQY